MKLFSLFICSILFLFSCRSVKEPVSTIEDIHFGTGGGITGELDDHYIDKNGVVYKHDYYIRTLSAEDKTKIFSQAQNFKSDTINNPGNMYYYINFKDSGITYNFVWSSKTILPKPELKDWYNQLVSYTKADE